MADEAVSVTHDEDAHRFVVAENGDVAELTYRTAGNQMVFLHTGVPSNLEGRGIGSALAKAGLEYAKAEGMQVVPLCPFVRSYIEREPEYQPLVRKASGGYA
jgi:uncharacterized protein